MDDKKIQPKHLMLRGSGGYKDYYLVAAKGKVGLGFKILGMSPKSDYAVSYAIRVRACMIDALELEAIYKDGGMAPPSPEIEAAWNLGTPWGSVDHKRVSTVFEEKVPGSFHLDEANPRELIVPEKIKSGEVRNGWVAMLVKASEGATKIILGDEQIADILAEYEAAMAAGIHKQLRQNAIIEEVQEEAQKSGLQQSQSELAAKIKAKFVAEFPEDVETGETDPEEDEMPDNSDQEVQGSSDYSDSNSSSSND